jgi:hypothetical protein
MWQDDDDLALRELSSARDTHELCRLLLQSAWGWRSSSRYAEAVDLLGKVQGTGTLPTAFCALLLCPCQRWQAVTAKLIAAIEGSGMLMAPDLDELAESFLHEDVTVRYSLAWLNPEWLTPEWLKDLANETGMASVAEDATGSDRRRIQPPLRQWAASRTLRREPPRLDELLAAANALPLTTGTRSSSASSTPPVASRRRSGGGWCGEGCGRVKPASAGLPLGGSASWTAPRRPAGPPGPIPTRR